MIYSPQFLCIAAVGMMYDQRRLNLHAGAYLHLRLHQNEAGRPFRHAVNKANTLWLQAEARKHGITIRKPGRGKHKHKAPAALQQPRGGCGHIWQRAGRLLPGKEAGAAL